MPTTPYKIVMLIGMELDDDEGRQEARFLRALTDCYKGFYLERDDLRHPRSNTAARVSRLELVVKYTRTKKALINQLDTIRESPNKPDGIHFIGHGWKSTADTFILAGQDPVSLKSHDDRDLFRDLGDGWMLFSCCYVGSDIASMRKLKDVSGRSVYAFSSADNPSLGRHDKKGVYGYQAFMVDAMLYHLMLVPNQNLDEPYDRFPERRIVNRLRSSVRRLGIGVKFSAAIKKGSTQRSKTLI